MSYGLNFSFTSPYYKPSKSYLHSIYSIRYLYVKYVGYYITYIYVIHFSVEFLNLFSIPVHNIVHTYYFRALVSLRKHEGISKSFRTKLIMKCTVSFVVGHCCPFQSIPL